MVKKKIDSRIRTLIENGVRLRHRSFMVLVGDDGRDQVVNLHFMLSKASVRTRPTVLWCYKTDLGFLTHPTKRQKKKRREIKRGLRDVDSENPFDLFVSCTEIRYCYYKHTHRILGNTYGMLVLQDFEAMTPNLLARTVETVEGGGLVILLFKTMSSLKQLYTMTMDVHARYRTEAHQDVVMRFNERFVLSLADCSRCLVLDDELNILPISTHVRNIKPIPLKNKEDGTTCETIESETHADLIELQETMKDTHPIGELIKAAKTLDQAKSILTFVEAISEKTLRSTVVMTAARGRGKSSALGLSIAGAVAYGYSNIFVTAPSPENLKTLFEMIFKGFDCLDFEEHTDYEIIQSTNPDFHKAVVRVNISRQHRQTIQYIQPQDSARLAQAELLVIDEAAAIPLPMVRNLLGSYLVFMSSTVNGYEGTGRSLSLKLIKQLRHQSGAASDNKKTDDTSAGGRVLREVTLEEPIRYAFGDPVEKWLNELLCLNCTDHIPRIIYTVPHPSKCELYYVNRDSLFSYHKVSEMFLQRMMSLYVSSHYKNTPNDLQLMSDSPTQHLFVLLGPQSFNSLPDIFVVLQVCLEGQISRQSVLHSLSRGKRKSGDLIPWCISQQFQNHDFASLSGARIIRIATHPELQRMGYASRALELLHTYYEGKICNLREAETQTSNSKVMATKEETLLTETPVPSTNQPLLVNLGDRPAEVLHFVGTSFGLTHDLYNFWDKNGYYPVYLRQTANTITGEHTCIMIRPEEGVALQTVLNTNWIHSFTQDFRQRFISLLGFAFRKYPVTLALNFLNDSIKYNPEGKKILAFEEMNNLMSKFDLKRLESYSRNLVDWHMILDLVPNIARLFFSNRLPLSFSWTQAAILLALGLQYKTVTELEIELDLGSTQILANFNKSILKVFTFLRSLEETEVKASIMAKQGKRSSIPNMEPLHIPLVKELQVAANDFEATELKKKEKTNKLLETLRLTKYEIGGSNAEWDNVLSNKRAAPGSVSMKSVEINQGEKKKKEEIKEIKEEAQKENITDVKLLVAKLFSKIHTQLILFFYSCFDHPFPSAH